MTTGLRKFALTARLIPALVGVVSLVYPVSSRFSLGWAVAAIVWSAGFVAVAEGTKNVGLPADDTGIADGRDPSAGTPRWMKVSGGIALVLFPGLMGLRFSSVVDTALAAVSVVTALAGGP
jgi:hypothetical protein